MNRNLVASVRARLANHAKATGRPFQEVLQHYGLERFLYRLSQSAERSNFVLKGGLLLRVWGAPKSRPTRDIDLLGFGESDIDGVSRRMRALCAEEYADGLIFDTETLKATRIKEDAEYEGVRAKFIGFLGRSRIPMQVDIGFGDIMHPAAIDSDYPVVLADMPVPRLRTYPRESVIAEKFQAMVYLGTANSRIKDFFDIWLMANTFDFEGEHLSKAIRKTFEQRGTEISTAPIALESDFMADPHTQALWSGFVGRSSLVDAPARLDELRQPMRAFLLPIAEALRESGEFRGTWQAGGPWR